MDDMESQIKAEKQRILDARQVSRMGEIALQRRVGRERTFLQFQNEGIPLSQAYFLTGETPRRIAGLIAAHLTRGDTPHKLFRGYKPTRFGIIRPKEYAEGWLVRFPQTTVPTVENSDTEHKPGSTVSLIARPDYTVISAKNTLDTDHLEPEEYAVEDDVVATMAQNGLSWVEPRPDFYKKA